MLSHSIQLIRSKNPAPPPLSPVFPQGRNSDHDKVRGQRSAGFSFYVCMKHTENRNTGYSNRQKRSSNSNKKLRPALTVTSANSPAKAAKRKMKRGSIIKKIIKTGAYKDIYRLIKETLIYMLFPNKYNPHKYDKK